MPVRENFTQVLKELIVPELQGIRAELSKIGSRLDVVASRLADFSARLEGIDQHLVDQGRRIDEFRMELRARFGQQAAHRDPTSRVLQPWEP